MNDEPFRSYEERNAAGEPDVWARLREECRLLRLQMEPYQPSKSPELRLVDGGCGESPRGRAALRVVRD